MGELTAREAGALGPWDAPVARTFDGPAETELVLFARPLLPDEVAAGLRIRQLKTGGTIYTEGAYSYVELSEASRPSEGAPSYRWRLQLTGELDFGTLHLPAGRYRFVSYQRPCAGACPYLDAPREWCETTLDLAAGVSADVLVSLRPTEGCSTETTVGTAAGTGRIVIACPLRVARCLELVRAAIEALPAGERMIDAAAVASACPPRARCYAAMYIVALGRGEGPPSWVMVHGLGGTADQVRATVVAEREPWWPLPPGTSRETLESYAVGCGAMTAASCLEAVHAAAEALRDGSPSRLRSAEVGAACHPRAFETSVRFIFDDGSSRRVDVTRSPGGGMTGHDSAVACPLSP